MMEGEQLETQRKIGRELQKEADNAQVEKKDKTTEQARVCDQNKELQEGNTVVKKHEKKNSTNRRLGISYFSC